MTDDRLTSIFALDLYTENVIPYCPIEIDDVNQESSLECTSKPKWSLSSL